VKPYQDRYILERGALYEMEQAVAVLKHVKPPVIPEWLASFMGEGSGGN